MRLSVPFLRFVARERGFTWIELLLVLAVLGILALMAIPAMQDSMLKKQVKEGLALADVAKKGVQAVWTASGEMPADNKAAGIPDKEKIVGNMIKEVAVDKGAIVLTYGNNASKAIEDKKVTLRPAVVKDTPAVPIAWICAQVSVPKGMEAMGADVTDIKASWLPIECRGPETNK
jgi:type IV pilus assembly protein PilA